MRCTILSCAPSAYKFEARPRRNAPQPYQGSPIFLRAGNTTRRVYASRLMGYPPRPRNSIRDSEPPTDLRYSSKISASWPITGTALQLARVFGGFTPEFHIERLIESLLPV